jgi:hypothetical protein
LALIQQEERVQQQKIEDEEQNKDPLELFMYALKAPETNLYFIDYTCIFTMI